MSIKEIKGNNFPEGNREIQGRQKKSEIKEKPQDIEHVSSCTSRASRSYGIANINFMGKSFRKERKEITSLIDKSPNHQIRAHKEDFLYFLSKDNIRIARLLINDKNIDWETALDVLVYTEKENCEAAEEVYKTITEYEEKLGNYYEDAVSCLPLIGEYNKELAVFMIQDEDFPLELFSNILSNAYTGEDTRAKTEAYKTMRDYKKQLGNNYARAIRALNYVGEHNLDLIKFMIQEEYFPKTEIENSAKSLTPKTVNFLSLITSDMKPGDDKNIEILETLQHLNFTKINENDYELYKYMIEDGIMKPHEVIAEIKARRFSSSVTSKEKKEMYLNNRSWILEKSNEIKTLKEQGYKTTVLYLQKSNGIELLFERKETPQGHKKKSSGAINKIRLNKNGVVLNSTCETYDRGISNTLEYTKTSDGKYSCNSYYGPGNTLTREIRIVNGKKGPLYVQETVASWEMRGVFDVTVYNLCQTDKDVNKMFDEITEEEPFRAPAILDKIKEAGIKGWNFSRTVENPDGTKSHIEKFQKGELHTKRVYTSNNDETKTSLDYTISDAHGKKLLSVHRTFELQGNKSITTLNGKKYIAEFDDEEMTVKIGDVEINFKEKMKNEGEKNQKILWNYLIKKTPADLILNFSNIKELEYIKGNGGWSITNNRISTENDLGTISHELGHYLDSTENNQYAIDIETMEDITDGEKSDYLISNNPELIKIYTEEIEDFKKNISEAEQKNFEYFSQTSTSPAEGLGELVAEVNALCSTQRNSNLQTRGLYLMRYFPKTISAAAKLLGY